MKKPAQSESVIFETHNPQETQKIASIFFETISTEKKKRTGALVVSLEGDLGAGKTTFMQGFAKKANVKEPVQSPTFVIMKIYRLHRRSFPKLLIHIDAYRISEKDLLLLGWNEFVQNKDAVVCVEWGSRIKKILPPDALHVHFRHEKKDQRSIEFA
jgi:tRNA threonylcarbamoyladenosine biosynthesis protein TsaE